MPESTKINSDQLKDEYALASHNHDSAYAAAGHDHSGIYSETGHTHDLLMRASETHIQWQYDGDMEWQNLVALADLKGENGSGVSLGLVIALT